MTATVTAGQRYTAQHPCPVCQGQDRDPRGQGRRCSGYLSDDRRFAFCTREEHAPGLILRDTQPPSYMHLLDGPCDCGQLHGESRSRAPYLNEHHRAESIGPIVAEYMYPGAEGQTRHRVTRHDPKTFRPWHWNGSRDWTMGEGGEKFPPYRLPELLAADPAQWVLIFEGEKDTDRAASLGFVATTNAGGAGKWRPELSEFLRGRRVCIIPDNDEPGERHAAVVAGLLVGIASDVRVLHLPNLPQKGDFSDWLDADGTAEELAWLIEHAPAPKAQPNATSSSRSVRFMTAREFAASTPADTPWVIEPFVPLGGITKIDGAPKKAGKTTLITHMVAAVLTGSAFLGKPTHHGPVVLLSEQGSTSFRESLARAGLLQRDDLYIATYRDFAGLDWSQVVGDACSLAAEVGAVLLVIDTIPACAGVRGDDENSAGRALEVMAPIQTGADAYNLGIVGTFHDKKGGGEVGESGRGSSAYAGAVDVILQVTRPGGNFSRTIRKIEALSRFEATPTELYIDLTDSGYVPLGSEDDVVSAALARALLDVLPESEETAKRIETVKDKDTDEVTERGILDDLAGLGLRVARSTLDAELKRWSKEGYVGQSGKARKGSPLRYWLIAKPPDAFFRSIGPDPSEERNDPPTTQTHADHEKVSSDAHPPSEESNSAPNNNETGQPILSSDAPFAYIGRNESSAFVGAAGEWF